MSVYVADKLDAARHSLSRSNIAKAICKASSREIMGPKKKHVDYLLACADNKHVNIINLAELLFERSRMSSWVIVSKSLVTFHNLMSAGSERFLQYLATRTTLWNLENFLDKSTVVGYDMSSFIRRYSNYLTQKVKSYVEMNYDFCRTKRGRDGVPRCLETPKLLKALGEIQILLDVLLEVDLQSSEFNNGVINSAFVLLFKDMIKLFGCYNDGILNLLEKYYEMSKEDCEESLNLYMKFVSRLDVVQTFLKVAQDIGLKETVIASLEKAPTNLLESLENHYQSLEKGKIRDASTKPPSLLPVAPPPVNEHTKFVETETQETKMEDKEASTPKTVLQAKEPAQPTPQDCLQTLLEPNEVEPESTETLDNGNDLLELQAIFAAQSSTASFPPNPNFGSTTAFGGRSTNNGFGSTQPDSWGHNINYTSINNNNNHKGTMNSSPFDTVSQTNFTDVLQPMNRPEPKLEPESETSKSELNSTLSKVAKSLDNFELFSPMTTANSAGTGHQWTAPKPKVKTGGANFLLNPVSGTTVPPTSPISPSMSTLPSTFPVSGTTRQQHTLGTGRAQPPMFGAQPAGYPQQSMMQNQVNMFGQQIVHSANPFSNSQAGNQALF